MFFGSSRLSGPYKLPSREFRAPLSPRACSRWWSVFSPPNPISKLLLPDEFPVIGGLCGSVFLDMAFKNYLRTIITEQVFNNITPRHMAKMMHEFEYCIKRQFSSKEDKSYIFDLLGVPGYTDIRLTRCVDNTP